MPSKQDSMLNCLFDSSIRYQRGDSIKPGKTYQALDLDTGGPLVIKSVKTNYFIFFLYFKIIIFFLKKKVWVR